MFKRGQYLCRPRGHSATLENICPCPLLVIDLMMSLLLLFSLIFTFQNISFFQMYFLIFNMLLGVPALLNLGKKLKQICIRYTDYNVMLQSRA